MSVTAISTALAIYFLVWWTVLFAILPWGVRSQAESGEIAPGTDPGAPVLPQLRLKMLWTTIVATIVFALYEFNTFYRLVGLDDLASLFGLLK